MAPAVDTAHAKSVNKSFKKQAKAVQLRWKARRSSSRSSRTSTKGSAEYLPATIPSEVARGVEVSDAGWFLTSYIAFLRSLYAYGFKTQMDAMKGEPALYVAQAQEAVSSIHWPHLMDPSFFDEAKQLSAAKKSAVTEHIEGTLEKRIAELSRFLVSGIDQVKSLQKSVEKAAKSKSLPESIRAQASLAAKNLFELEDSLIDEACVLKTLL